MKKLFLYFAAILGLILVFTEKALAVCPICTIAVGAGVGLSRWLGIDDSITGLWVGGLTVSMITWTISWLDKKNIRFRGRTAVTILGYYSLIVVPLYFMGIMGNPLSTLCACGILDKLLLGIVAGSFGFWFGASWYYYLKEKNQGRAYFPFQKVVMPVSPLILLSIIFYFLIK
jgi:predicted outer membrane lipoprotein